MRRKKGLTSTLVGKFPVIVVLFSFVVGGFFGYKIIKILTTQKESGTQVSPLEQPIPQPEEEPKITVVRPKDAQDKEAEKSLASTVIFPPLLKKNPEQKRTSTVPGEEPTPPKKFRTIQIAAFRKEEQAKALAKTLGEKDFSPLYIRQDGKWFKVWAGKFETHEQAEEYLSLLKQDFPDAFLRRLEKPFTPASASSSS